MAAQPFPTTRFQPVAALAVAFGLLSQPQPTSAPSKPASNGSSVPAQVHATPTVTTARNQEADKSSQPSTAASPLPPKIEAAAATVDKLPLVGSAPKPSYRAVRPKKKSSPARGEASGNSEPDPGF